MFEKMSYISVLLFEISYLFKSSEGWIFTIKKFITPVKNMTPFQVR